MCHRSTRGTGMGLAMGGLSFCILGEGYSSLTLGSVQLRMAKWVGLSHTQHPSLLIKFLRDFHRGPASLTPIPLCPILPLSWDVPRPPVSKRTFCPIGLLWIVPPKRPFFSPLLTSSVFLSSFLWPKPGVRGCKEAGVGWGGVRYIVLYVDTNFLIPNNP